MQKYSYTFFLTLLGVLSLYLLQDFIMPVLMGGIGAVVLYKPTRILNIKVKNYKLAALIMGLLGTSLILLPLGFVLLSGTGELVSFLKQGEIIPQVIKYLQELSPKIQKIAPFIPPVKIQEYSAILISFINTKALGILQTLLIQFPNLLMQLLITLISCYSFLSAGPRVQKILIRQKWFSPEQTNKLHEAVIKTTQSVVVAAMISGLLQALVMGVIASLILPQKILLISILIFFCSFIPVINTFPVTISFFIWSLSVTGVFPLVMVLVGTGIILAIDTFLKPIIMGSKAKMHPLVAFLSALGGLSVLGFYGLFLGPIIVGVFLNLVEATAQTE